MADPISQYQIREMLELMAQRPRPTTFLRSLTVKTEKTHKTKYLEIDQIFGGQQVAGYVSRQGGPNPVGKAGYESIIHLVPYLYDEIAYTPSDVDIRPAGQTVYTQPVDPAASMVAQWLADLEDRFIRAEERQVAQALTTGKITVSGKDVEYEVDFNQAGANIKTLTGADSWDETTATILDDLRDWSQQMLDNGAPAPDVLVCDVKAGALLKTNADVLEILDVRNVNTGDFTPKQLRGMRATYEGRLAGSGFDLSIYTYQGMYQAMNGSVLTNYRYMPDNTVLLLSTEMDARMHYGKIENFLAEQFEAKRFPNRYENPNGKQRFVSLESGPMFGLHQPDCVIAVTVI